MGRPLTDNSQNTQKRSLIWTILLLGLLFIAGKAGAESLNVTSKTILKVKQEQDFASQKRLQSLQDLIDSAQVLPELEQVELVNAFFNRLIEYKEDRVHWGRLDYWATPAETLVTQRGDCEDYAVAKYFTLMAIGIPEERLRLQQVLIKKSKQAHMVLGYYPRGYNQPLILDNRINPILHTTARSDLAGVFSFNRQGLWLEGKLKARQTGGSPQHLAQWVTMNSRLSEGEIGTVAEGRVASVASSSARFAPAAGR